MKRLTTLMIILISVFTLAGCNQTGDYITKVGITHIINGKFTEWTAEGQDVDSLKEWASELEYKRVELEEGQSPYDGDGEMYGFTLPEGNYPVFSYVINEPGDCYLLIDDCWYSVSNPSDPPVTEPQKEKLTLEKVKELAKKGEALSWSDFEQFDGYEIGSGLYILHYDIDENYSLRIGGGDKRTSPMYIRLIYRVGSGKCIDIRTESIDDFIDSLNN